MELEWIDFPRGLEYNYYGFLYYLLEYERRIVWAIYQSDRLQKNGIFLHDGLMICVKKEESLEQ